MILCDTNPLRLGLGVNEWMNIPNSLANLVIQAVSRKVIHGMYSAVNTEFIDSLLFQQDHGQVFIAVNSRFPLLRFRSALHCGYSGITTDKDSGLQ
jgi:hypothetical protein